MTDETSTIGVAGIGRMGAAIASRLLSLGRTVAVWNRTPGKTEDLASRGARVVATPAQLASVAGIVISTLSDSEAIAAVYRGKDGLLAEAVTGRLFIEMSTVRPGSVQALAVVVEEVGASLVDCPVGGSVGPALEGRLIGLVGGAVDDVARSRPVLDQLCRRVEHVGPVGAGSRMKLAIQLPVHLYWQALGEALALCAPLGLDPERLIDIFADTPGASRVLRERADAIASVLRGESPGPVAFDIDSIRKDLGAMIAETRALGSESPMAELALESFDDAARDGQGGEHAAAVTSRWAQRTRHAPPS